MDNPGGAGAQWGGAESPRAERRPELQGEPGSAVTLWRQRNFLLLWSGQTVSEMGSAVTQLALPLTAVVVLRASTFQVGLLTSAATAAFALIALPAGALVDRRPKRRLMIWCDAARMLIIGSVPLAAAFGVLTLGQLYAVAVTAGVCTVFFDVAYQSYLPVVVAKEHLVDGNGKLGATQSFAQVTGPGLGGGPAAPGWRVAAFAVGMAFLSFGAVVYNVAQVSYRQAICPPRLLGRMNAAVRWVVWGTIPLGALLGGVFGTLIGVRATLWIAFVGSWAAGWWVFFSPLRGMRALEDERAPGSGVPGHGGRELADGAGPQLGD